MSAIPKRAILLSGVVGEDRQLKVELPVEVPIGQVELIIMVPGQPAAPADHRLKDLQSRLEANGTLANFHFPDPTIAPAPLTDAQLLELGTLPLGARPSHELIHEDREDRV